MRPHRREGCCEHCGLEWQPANYGSPRRCAFEGEVFSPDNWNCGLEVRIRRAMIEDAEDPGALHVRNDFGVGSVGALVVDIPVSGPGADPLESDLAGLLVADWYKNRGQLQGLKWALCINGIEAEEVTREQAIKIVRWLDAREAAQQRREEDGRCPSSAPAFDFAAFLNRGES